MGGAASKLKNVERTDPRLVWSVVGDLGSGTYGKVHKVRQRQSGMIAAAKVAPIPSEDKLADFAPEVNILSGTQHVNITNFVGAYYFDMNLWILIELAAGGSIGDLIKRRHKGLEEVQIKAACFQMLSALSFLHENAIIHRDLNASNVLLAEGGVVKIADFGVSAKNKTPRDRRNSFIGTPNWMAPEVIVCENDKSKPYDNKCDIWSLGITLIEFAELKAPHHDLHPMKVLFKITASAPPTLSKPEGYSADFNSFLKQALAKLADQRPPAIELMGHPFAREGKNPEPLRILFDQVPSQSLLSTPQLYFLVSLLAHD
jgi:serine/threonine protein kinase